MNKFTIKVFRFFKPFSMASLYLFIFLVSCKEHYLGIDYAVAPQGQLVLDSQYTTSGLPSTFDKIHLIEEFSGVECVNCPTAAREVEGQDTTHKGRIISIAMHSNLDGTLSDSLVPKPTVSFFGWSKSAYKNVESDVLRNLLGPNSIGQLPQICLNRNKFAGSDIVFSQPTQLSGYLNSELTKNSPSRITFDSASFYDPSVRTITLHLTVEYGSSVLEADYLSVAITESKIKDWQKKFSSNGLPIYDSNYIHNHVLRKYIFPQSGILLSNAAAGKVYKISFKTFIPKEWNTDNLQVIAILHKQNAATGNYSVSQANQIKVK